MGPIRALSNQMEACLPILNLGITSRDSSTADSGRVGPPR
jgi:hypothetical protein